MEDSIVKKKTPSGFLVINKKSQGSDGNGTSSSKKKRPPPPPPTLMSSDSDSSDELLETMRRKAKAEKSRNREVDGKKRGMDLFEFDEYDEFEVYKEFRGSGSRKNLMGKKRKKHSSMDVSNSVGSGKSKGVDLDEDEEELQMSLLSLKYQNTPEENVRLQGKNGLLKVMVNDKKKSKTDLSRDVEKLQPSCNSESKQLKKRKSIVKCEKEVSKTGSFISESSADDDIDSDGADTSLKMDPSSLHVRSSSKVIKEERSKIKTSTLAKGKEGKVRGGGSIEKQQLREAIREMLITSGWTIDYRPRRNRDYHDAVYIHPSGTAYWSITKAYETLQKQFDGRQGKHKSAVLSSSFAHISEDLISKLTRKPRKKTEEKMKKRKEDGIPSTSKQTAKNESVEAIDSDHPEETLSSYIRKKRKLSKNRMHDLCDESGSESSDNSCKITRGDRVEKSLISAKNRILQGRLGSLIQRSTLRIRDLDKAQNFGSDGYVAYSGKRTILSWLVDSGIVQSGGKVQYMNHRRTRVRLEGWITKEGIHCGCCSKIVTVSKFELHAGSMSRRPFQNICLESGVSLLQCQIDAWNQQDKSECRDFNSIDVDGDDPDDDTCGTCGDGGDLICCDSCPSTFHQSCLEIKKLPLGDWNCPNCVCKFCGTASLNEAVGDLSGHKLSTCSLCERKYHKACSADNCATPVDSSNGTAQFCGLKCQELYDHVWKILGVKHELEAGFSWSLLRRTDIDSDVANSGFAKRVECNSKLAVAHSVIDECFLPIIDRRSGINLIHSVLYNCGSNFPRLNYSSFYSAILERGDDLISVASIRIHGTHLAEMPFIGTRHIYRRQGMCSRLLSAIESALSSFKVEKLIIPAISEHMNTWTTSFGFNPLEEDLKKYMKSLNMLVFPGTDMLQKQLVKPMADDAKDIDLTDIHSQPPALTRKSSHTSSGDDEDEDKDETLDKTDEDSSSSDSAAPSNIIGPSAPSPDSTSKSGIQLSVAETASDQNNLVLESASGSKCSSSLCAPSTSLADFEKHVDPLRKDNVQSFMVTATGDRPAGTVTSSGEDLYAVPKDDEDSAAHILAGMDGKDFVRSDVVSDADVNIQSTPCEVKMKDHDRDDSSFDNARTYVNGRLSCLEDGSKNQGLSFSTDLNKPVVGVKDGALLVSATEVDTVAEVACVKAITNTSLVCGVGNHEHVNASNDSNVSEEINEQSNLSSPAGGRDFNSRSCNKQSVMRNESCEASTLSCEVNALTTSNISSDAELDMKHSSVQAPPGSLNVCLPHDVVEVHKNQDTISLSTFHGSMQNASCFECTDLTDSRIICNEINDTSGLAIQPNGKGKVISDETVPIEATNSSNGESKLAEPSKVVEDVACGARKLLGATQLNT